VEAVFSPFEIRSEITACSHLNFSFAVYLVFVIFLFLAKYKSKRNPTARAAPSQREKAAGALRFCNHIWNYRAAFFSLKRRKRSVIFN